MPETRPTGRSALRRAVYPVWWRMHADGDSLREVAEVAGEAVSTVCDGVKAYEAHLAELPEAGRIAAMVDLYESAGMVAPRWLRKLFDF